MHAGSSNMMLHDDVAATSSMMMMLHLQTNVKARHAAAIATVRLDPTCFSVPMVDVDVDDDGLCPNPLSSPAGVLKAGFAGGDRPKIIFSSAVGRPKHLRMMPGGALEGSDL